MREKKYVMPQFIDCYDDDDEISSYRQTDLLHTSYPINVNGKQKKMYLNKR